MKSASFGSASPAAPGSPSASPTSVGVRPGLLMGGGMIGGAKPFHLTGPQLPKPAPLGVAFAGQQAQGTLGMTRSRSSRYGAPSNYEERASIDFIEVVEKRVAVLEAEKLRLQMNINDPRASDRIKMIEAEKESITEDPQYVSALQRLEYAAEGRAALARRKQLLEIVSEGQSHLREVQEQVRIAESRQNTSSGALIQAAIEDVQHQIGVQQQLLVRLQHNVDGMDVALAHINYRLMQHQQSTDMNPAITQEAQRQLKEKEAENDRLRETIMAFQDKLSEQSMSRKKIDEDHELQAQQLRNEAAKALEQQAALRRRLADLAREKDLYVRESGQLQHARDRKYNRLFGDIEFLEVQVGSRAPPEPPELSDAGKTHTSPRDQAAPPVTPMGPPLTGPAAFWRGKFD